MSGTEGKRETLISSPRDKKKESYQAYRFLWVKKVIDSVFIRHGINGEKIR